MNAPEDRLHDRFSPMNRHSPARIGRPFRASSGHCRHSPNGRYGIFGRDSVGSLRLDAGGLDHFGPLLGFGSNVLAKISRWATERCGAEVGKPRLHPGIGQGRVDCPVEGFDNLCRRALSRLLKNSEKGR